MVPYLRALLTPGQLRQWQQGPQCCVRGVIILILIIIILILILSMIIIIFMIIIGVIRNFAAIVCQC